MYLNYCLPFEDKTQLEFDNRRVSENLTGIKIHYRAFFAGLLFGLVVRSNPANAVDESAAKAAAAKRASNAFGCGAVAAVCGKLSSSAAGKEAAKQAVGADPKLLAAFACGFAASWCIKYVIFDN